jgi:hypothetical protein
LESPSSKSRPEQPILGSQVFDLSSGLSLKPATHARNKQRQKVSGLPRHPLMLRDAAVNCQFQFSNRTAVARLPRETFPFTHAEYTKEHTRGVEAKILNEGISRYLGQWNSSIFRCSARKIER